MRELLRHGLAEEGSFGLSLGLEYFSGRHSDTAELVALAAELPAYNGVYISHLRSQGSAPMWYKPSVDGAAPPPTLEEALAEIIRVAEQTGCIAVATHIKGWGPGYRGRAAGTVATINAARARGLRLYADVYPYDSAGSDGDFVALPTWAIGSGRAPGVTAGPRDYRPELRRIVAAGDRDGDLRRDVEHQVALKGGAENIHVLDYPNPAWVGRTLADIMRTETLGLTELAVRLQLEGDPGKAGGAKLRAVSMEQRDVDLFVTQPWTAGSTDGWIVLPEEAVGPKKYLNTNRRCFGSFPWRLINYTRDRRLESIEESVRKCTGLPAEILNLRDRGRLAPGCKADIAVIDLAGLRDHTTILEPNEYATGVEHVFVNGVAVIHRAERTLRLPGRVLIPAGARLGGEP
jgi:N-acyl-D-amino-acid deacylase